MEKTYVLPFLAFILAAVAKGIRGDLTFSGLGYGRIGFQLDAFIKCSFWV